MTLKKDAVVCVSLAGVVFLMAVFSRINGRTELPSQAGQTGQGESEIFHRPMYQLYVDAVNNINGFKAEERENWLRDARGKVRSWYEGGQLSAPIDLFRAAAVLATSTESKELDLAYELSLSAWSKGVRTARRLSLETQDRLLLSIGQDQRYGTQSKWQGKPLPDFGNPSTDLTPAMRVDLGLNKTSLP